MPRESYFLIIEPEEPSRELFVQELTGGFNVPSDRILPVWEYTSALEGLDYLPDRSVVISELYLEGNSDFCEPTSTAGLLRSAVEKGHLTILHTGRARQCLSEEFQELLKLGARHAIKTSCLSKLTEILEEELNS